MQQGVVQRAKKIVRALSCPDDYVADAPLDLKRILRIRKRVLCIGAAVACPLMLVHRSAWPADSIVHAVAVRCGILLLAVAIAGRIWVWAHRGRRKRWQIVADGPYSIMCHPLYAFSILGAVGIGAQSGSLLMGLLFMVAVWSVFHCVARIEEADMTSRFGEQYRAYRARTPRFVPNFALWIAPPAISVEYPYVSTCLRDACWFLLAVPAFIAIDWLQQAAVLPVLFRLP
jgi:protein-S-isoprenylcysteine O-methyltransferase Ste14